MLHDVVVFTATFAMSIAEVMVALRLDLRTVVFADSLLSCSRSEWDKKHNAKALGDGKEHKGETKGATPAEVYALERVRSGGPIENCGKSVLRGCSNARVAFVSRGFERRYRFCARVSREFLSDCS